jgi:hypothetical protein
MLRINTGRFFDSGGVKKRRALMRRRRMEPRGATMRITAKKWCSEMMLFVVREDMKDIPQRGVTEL